MRVSRRRIITLAATLWFLPALSKRLMFAPSESITVRKVADAIFIDAEAAQRLGAEFLKQDGRQGFIDLAAFDAMLRTNRTIDQALKQVCLDPRRFLRRQNR